MRIRSDGPGSAGAEKENSLKRIATAFVLALLADFTALPGALWILSRFERRPATRTA